jgi:hypothetical protein
LDFIWLSFLFFLSFSLFCSSFSYLSLPLPYKILLCLTFILVSTFFILSSSYLPHCVPLCGMTQSTTASRTAHRNLPIALKHEVRSRMAYPYLASSTPVYLPCSHSGVTISVRVRVRLHAGKFIQNF